MVPPGNIAFARSIAVTGRMQAAADVADYVDDVGVVLVHHEFGDFHRAVRTHPAQVVPFEIDEHDVLSPLFRVEVEFVGQLIVLGSPPAARAGPGDGPRLGPAVTAECHETFGRRRDEFAVAEVEVACEGRRVHGAQRLVQMQTRQRVAEVEALRQVGLEDVAGEHILPGSFDRSLILPAPEVGAEHREVVVVEADRGRPLGAHQCCPHARPLAVGRRVVGTHPVEEQRLPGGDLVLHDLAGQEDVYVGESEVVAGRVGEGLQVAHGVVGDETEQRFALRVIARRRSLSRGPP